MKLRCPCCHASNSLESFTADDAGRELLRLLAGTGPLFRPLVAYLGLFRPPSRDLSHQRALKLTTEVLEFAHPAAPLGQALTETVEAMRQKRDNGQIKPLTNHNYLKRVLETVAATPNVAIATRNVADALSGDSAPAAAPRGKRAQALVALEQWAGSDWLRQEIAAGLQALVALSRPGTPAAETIALTADIWHVAITGSYQLTDETIDKTRIHKAFKGLLQQDLKDWPAPAALKPHMPARPRQQTLDEPTRSDSETVTGIAAAQKIREMLNK